MLTKTYITLDGKTKHVTAWLKLLHINPHYFRERLEHGMTPEEALQETYRAFSMFGQWQRSLKKAGYEIKTEQDVKDALTELSAKHPASTIARMIGLHQVTVSRKLREIPGATVRKPGGAHNRSGRPKTS